MSNRPTPPQRPSNNPLMNLLLRIFDFITNPRLANFAQIYPLLIAILLALATIIVGLDLKASFAILNSNQICKSYEIQVRERLRIEGHENISIETKPFVDNSNINQWLPFSCEYTIKEGNKKLESKKVLIEFNPLFPDLINDIDSNFEEEIKMDTICEDETIKKQMINKSKEEKNIKKVIELYQEKQNCFLKRKKACIQYFDGYAITRSTHQKHNRPVF